MIGGSPIVKIFFFSHQLILGNETIYMSHWIVTMCVDILNVLICPSVDTFSLYWVYKAFPKLTCLEAVFLSLFFFLFWFWWHHS